jgi:hypothetical protein
VRDLGKETVERRGSAHTPGERIRKPMYAPSGGGHDMEGRGTPKEEKVGMVEPLRGRTFSGIQGEGERSFGRPAVACMHLAGKGVMAGAASLSGKTQRGREEGHSATDSEGA